MLKIWQVNVKNGTKYFISIQEARDWADRYAIYPRDNPVRWNTSGDNLELRDTVNNEVIAIILGLRVEEPNTPYTGEVIKINVKYPFEKLEKDMMAVFTCQEAAIKITYLHQVGVQVGRINTTLREFIYTEYKYSIVSLAKAIQLEDDPLKKAAYQVLMGDPQACDLMRDVLRC